VPSYRRITSGRRTSTFPLCSPPRRRLAAKEPSLFSSSSQALFAQALVPRPLEILAAGKGTRGDWEEELTR
jgi:hypothetical protein